MIGQRYPQAFKDYGSYTSIAQDSYLPIPVLWTFSGLHPHIGAYFKQQQSYTHLE